MKIKLLNGQKIIVSNIIRNNDDNIIFAICKKPTKINTSIGKIKVEYEIGFHENGEIGCMFLKKPKIINTIIGKIKCNNTILFYDNKMFQGGCFNNPTYVPTIQGNLQLHSYISFYKTGELKVLNITDPYTLKTPTGSLTFSPDNKITLFKNGEVESGTLLGKAEIENKIVEGYIEFDKNGKLKEN